MEERNATVDSLIDSNTQWWNIDKIRVLFNPRIATKILKIIINPNSSEDKWIWSHEKMVDKLFIVPIDS